MKSTTDLYFFRNCRKYLELSLDNLKATGKLSKIEQQIEFMIDGLDEYISLKIGEDELESRYGDLK